MPKTAADLKEDLERDWKVKTFKKWLKALDRSEVEAAAIERMLPVWLTRKQKKKVAAAILKYCPEKPEMVRQLKLLNHLKSYYSKGKFKRLVKNLNSLLLATEDFRWIAYIFASARDFDSRVSREEYEEAREKLVRLSIDSKLSKYMGISSLCLV